MGAIFMLMYLLFGISIIYPVVMWVRWKLFYSNKISLKEYWKEV